jgi:predicted nucleic acid-binding protein
MRILADSSILLRLFEPGDPRTDAVLRTVAALKIRGDALVTAAQNVAEFWNVCTRPASARGGFGLSLLVAEQRLQRVERGFTLLPELPTTYAIWRGLIVAHAVMGKQVHDARLAAIVLSHGVTQIVTLNGRDFARYPGLTVIDPLTFPATP